MSKFHSVVAATPATAAVFLKSDAQPYSVGDLLRNPRLPNTLAAIAEGGRTAFYEGPIAAAVADYLAQHGGLLTADDFAQHSSEWTAPLEVNYRGYRALNVPPNAQGFAALQILGMLDRFDVASLRDDPVGYLDLMVRATALAFEDRDRYLTDPAFSPIPIDRLVSDNYIGERAELLRGQSRVEAGTVAPLDATSGTHEDTTFSCCVDGDGNAVGVIQSLYFEWGSGVVAGETGLLLQNRGAFFSLDEAHPNRLEPGKRTFHTLIVGMLVDASDRPALVYGCMGGEGQPQSQAALATRVVDFGLNVQAAIDAPRWLYGRTWGEQYRGLRLEGRFGADVVEGLRARGHQRVSLVEDWTDLMGHAQAIQVWPDRLEAGADPRADGAALGF
jgi:gamma-glutamyltranspeptidase/glutathione hydrolase